MKPIIGIVSSLLISSTVIANNISKDNLIEWLGGGENTAFLCGNDNCEFLAEKNQTFGFSPMDAVIKYYPFQDFSDKLTLEMEDQFDAFIFINTSEGQSLSCGKNPLNIPSQFGRIIWKNSPLAKPVFSRASDGKITGVIDASVKIIPGLDNSFFDGRNALDGSVLDFLKDNPRQNYFPVSTGTMRNIARTMTPSGIFAVDFNYTNYYRSRTEANPYEHMPNTILADAKYGDNYQNRKFAFGIHGTPEIFISCKKSFPNGLTINEGCPPCPISSKINLSKVPVSCVDMAPEKALGVKRDSAGCIRTYTPASKVIFNWAWSELRHPAVPVLNPNFNIPTGKLPTRRAPGMKILIIPFSGYSETQNCTSA
jgi:hypothetical protein